MLFVMPYYHKIFIFALLERWLIYDCETECTFAYLIPEIWATAYLMFYLYSLNVEDP